jgi:hypothetical protein
MRLAPAHEAGVKLQRMIKRTRQYLFVFVTNRDIPATNNGPERALRPAWIGMCFMSMLFGAVLVLVSTIIYYLKQKRLDKYFETN